MKSIATLEASEIAALATIQNKLNRESALELVKRARETLESAIGMLENYAEQIEMASSNQEKSKLMNYMLHHLACNITPNLRLDLFANLQAEFASTGDARSTGAEHPMPKSMG